MTIALNIYCIAVMLFGAITLAFHVCFLGRQSHLSSHLHKLLPINLVIMCVANFLLAFCMSIANFSIDNEIADESVVNAWVTQMPTIIAVSIFYGCRRRDIRERSSSILLSVGAYYVCLYAFCESAYGTCMFGNALYPTFVVAEVAYGILDYVGLMFIWHAVRMAGSFNSQAHRRATIFNCIMSTLGCVMMILAPFAGGIYVQPGVLGTTHGAWYHVAVAPQFLMGIVTLVTALRAGSDTKVKTTLFLFTFFTMTSLGYSAIIDDAYQTPLVMAVGGFGCYLGIVAQRANAVSSHLEQIDVASAVQQMMLPQMFPTDDRFSVYAHMWPAKEVAGDFYDFYQPDPDNLYILIADVSGKDVPAAMFMAGACALIREHEKAGLLPDEIFNRVNRALAEGNTEMLFVTAWMAKFNLSEGVMTFANAGHNPPIVFRQGVGEYYLHTKPNLVLGALKKTKYERQQSLLKKGDRIIVYTDGVTESINMKEEQFGEDKLLEFANNSENLGDKERAERLYATVGQFAEGMEQFDDVTVLCMTYFGNKTPDATGFSEEIFPAECEKLDEVNAFIEKAALELGYPEEHLIKLEMCVEEIFINVCNYAYIGTEERRLIRISLTAANDEIRIVFSDTGIPFNPLMQLPPDFEERAKKKTIGGLGIYLVRELMDDVRYRYIVGENRLEIVKKLSGDVPPAQ